MSFRDESNLGLVRLDAHHASKVQASTHKRYRQRVGAFCSWLIQNSYYPDTPIQFDDMIMEWKVDTNPSKADFENLLAAVEFVLPRIKGKLQISRACAAGWARVHRARHTVPCTRQLAHLLACHLCAAGRHRLAVGLLVQQELGLRPNEMLCLLAGDVSLPEDQPGSRGAARAVLGLGLRTGTKAKRPQAAVLRDGRLIGLMRWLKANLEPHQPLVPENYEQYRRALKSAEARVGLTVGITPHSPRAGFATDRMAEGWSFVEIREGGRWVADNSLRTYLDIVASASIALDLRLSGLNNAIVFSIAHLMEYLPFAVPYQRASDHVASSHFPRREATGRSTQVTRFGSSVPAAAHLDHGPEGREEGRRRVLFQRNGREDGSSDSEPSETSEDDRGRSGTLPSGSSSQHQEAESSAPGLRGHGRGRQGRGGSHQVRHAAAESRRQGRGCLRGGGRTG